MARRRLLIAVLIAGAAPGAPAIAQSMQTPSLTIEAGTQERRRGIGWSADHPIVRVGAEVPVGDGLSINGTATSLGGNNRQFSAEGVVDLGADYSRDIGPWRLTAHGRYHIFPGAGDADYAELGGTADYMIGPITAGLSSFYAPGQSSIGGDNLYIAGHASVGLPGRPVTLSAHLGRSSGDDSTTAGAARLRPDGDYWDHGVAIDWFRGRWSASLRYADTDIATNRASHVGASLVATVGVTL